MIKGIIWNKKANLDHLVISFQCIPQAASREERYSAGHDWQHARLGDFEWEKGGQAVLVTANAFSYYYLSTDNSV